LQEMEAIGDLPRLWRALSCALRIQTAAVAADDFDLRMLANSTESRFSQIRSATGFAILLIRRNGEWRGRWSLRHNRVKRVLLVISRLWRRFWVV
jgi:hypothetical protein